MAQLFELPQCLAAVPILPVGGCLVGRVVLFANTEWYLYNFRRAFAAALRDAGYSPLLISPPGPYGQRLRDLGFDWRPVPMDRRSLNPISEIRLIAHLVRLLRDERPVLVHGFTIKCAVYLSIAARIAGVPGRVSAVAGMGYVFSSRDTRARALRPLVAGLLRLSLGGRSSRLILQNATDVEVAKRLKLGDPGHIRLIPGSGVDLARFRPRVRARAPGDPVKVLLASRLLWDKGIGEFVDAARELKARGLPIRFLIAGTSDPGNPSAVPAEVLDGWVREGAVEWLGHVEDMPALLGEVDILTLPSYYGEGFPKILIEGAACGLPIVTTDSPGCRDVVVDGADGLLVPPRDPGALAEAIAVVAGDPALAARLGAAARRKALDEFDVKLVVERTLAVYREVIGFSG